VGAAPRCYVAKDCGPLLFRPFRRVPVHGEMSVAFMSRSARLVRLIADGGDGGYASAAEVRVAVT